MSIIYSPNTYYFEEGEAAKNGIENAATRTRHVMAIAGIYDEDSCCGFCGVARFGFGEEEMGSDR